MELSTDHPAVETLRSFFDSMYSWESEMLRHHRSLDWDNIDEVGLAQARKDQRRKIEAIFDKFCEVGSKAKRLQDVGLAFDGDSPEYDWGHELIVSVALVAGRVVVETKQIHKLGWRYRYELIDSGAGWRIRDNKKRGSDKNTQWRADML